MESETNRKRYLDIHYVDHMLIVDANDIAVHNDNRHGNTFVCVLGYIFPSEHIVQMDKDSIMPGLHPEYY